MILGKNLIVSLDGVAIAGAKSCQLEMTRQFLQTCSPTESQVLDKVPTLYDWSVSCDGLIPASSLTSGLEDKLINGTKCFITFTDGNGNNRAGFVYVKSCRESGAVGSLATFSASFESTGKLHKCLFYNNGSWPQDSQEWELSIYNNAIRVDQPQGYSGGLYMVQVSPSTNGTIYIFTSAIWAASHSKSVQDLNAYLSQNDPQSFESFIDEFKQGSGTLTTSIEYQSWAIVCNAKPSVVFLYP